MRQVQLIGIGEGPQVVGYSGVCRGLVSTGLRQNLKYWLLIDCKMSSIDSWKTKHLRLLMISRGLCWDLRRMKILRNRFRA